MAPRRQALLGLAGVAAVAVAVAAYFFAIRSTSASDLGTVNSVTVRGERGRLCVSDSYDENHCRVGDPLILPSGGVVKGDCVEVRTKSRSNEIVVVRATADPCFRPYDR